jgi:hypothetical protein
MLSAPTASEPPGATAFSAAIGWPVPPAPGGRALATAGPTPQVTNAKNGEQRHSLIKPLAPIRAVIWLTVITPPSEPPVVKMAEMVVK